MRRVILSLLIALSPSLAHARGHHHHHPSDANGNSVKKYSHLSQLVSDINRKLRRYVHRTGRCAGGDEQLATYYWQGSRVATGARFNPHGLSVASRTLPFGTHLRVTNPHNGRAVTVVVNDRGPYTDAKLDLSLGAARALGMTQSSYVCVVRS